MYVYLKGCVISRSKGPTFFLGKSVTSSHEAFLSKLGQTKSQKWISFKEDMKHVIISSTSRNLDDSGQGIKIMNGQLRSNNDKNCNWIILADFSLCSIGGAGTEETSFLHVVDLRHRAHVYKHCAR